MLPFQFIKQFLPHSLSSCIISPSSWITSCLGSAATFFCRNQTVSVFLLILSSLKHHSDLIRIKNSDTLFLRSTYRDLTEYIERSSRHVSLIIREMWMKTTMIYPLVSIKMSIIVRQETKILMRMWKQEDICTLTAAENVNR